MPEPTVGLTLGGFAGSCVAVAGLVAANGFFVAAEFALVSVRRSRIDELVEQGVKVAATVRTAIHDLDRYIAGTQVGITIASLALGWVGEPALVPIVEPVVRLLGFGASAAVVHTIAIALAFAMISFLHVVLGELVPKSLALQKPEATALLIARPMWFAAFVFQPLIWALNGCGNWLLRRLGVEPAGEHHGVHSADELEILVHQSHEAGVFDDQEKQMLQRTFRFAHLKANEVMVPRPDIAALDLTRPIEENLDKIARTFHSRLPVHEGNIDNITGILHIQDVYKHLHGNKPVSNLASLARPPLFVPETMPLDDVLQRFREARTQIAIVLDEYGVTAGLVTLEDLVEEIFGEVQDSPAADVPRLLRQDDGRMIVRGEVRLDEVNEFSGWQLDDPNADTLAGYIMNRLGRVARLQDKVETPFGHLVVIDMARLRIKRVALEPKPVEAPAE